MLTVAGCSDERAEPLPPASVEGSSSAVSGAPCVPTPALTAAVPPPPVALPAGAVLTDVRQAGAQRLVSGRVEATVDEVLAHFRSAPGFVVSRDEDEGRAGELQLFGAAGDVGVTVARLTCPRGATSFTVAVTQASPSG